MWHDVGKIQITGYFFNFLAVSFILLMAGLAVFPPGSAQAESDDEEIYAPGNSYMVETYPQEPDLGEDEGAKMNIRFEDERNHRVRRETVTFYVESDRDDIAIELAEEIDGEVTVMPESAELAAWEVEAETDIIGSVTLEITGKRAGEATVRVGGWEDHRVNPVFGRGEQVYTFQTEGITGVRLGADEDRVEPTESFELKAELREDDYPAREGMTVRFEARCQGEEEWEQLDEKATDESGLATLEMDSAVADDYEFRAYHPGEPRLFATTEVEVVPGPVDDVISWRDEKEVDVEKDEFTVHFALVDEYDNWITDKDQIAVEVEGPQGEYWDLDDPKVSLELVEECKEDIKHEMFAVTVTHEHDEGIHDYLVEGRVAGTTIVEQVNAKLAEFGQLVDMNLQLDKEAVPVDYEEDAKAAQDEDEVEAKPLYARVMLEGEHGVTRIYDPEANEEDILFSSSNASVATINRDTGEISVRGPGETEIRVYHSETGLDDTAELNVYDPEVIEEKEELDELEAETEVQVITLPLDENVIRVNDEEVEVGSAPLIEDGRAFLPLPVMADIFAAELEFDPHEAQVTAAMEDTTAVFYLDEPILEKDDETVELDAAPFLNDEDELVYLPLRFVTRAVDADIDYDNETREIIIEK